MKASRSSAKPCRTAKSRAEPGTRHTDGRRRCEPLPLRADHRPNRRRPRGRGLPAGQGLRRRREGTGPHRRCPPAAGTFRPGMAGLPLEPHPGRRPVEAPHARGEDRTLHRRSPRPVDRLQTRPQDHLQPNRRRALPRHHRRPRRRRRLRYPRRQSRSPAAAVTPSNRADILRDLDRPRTPKAFTGHHLCATITAIGRGVIAYDRTPFGTWRRATET